MVASYPSAVMQSVYSTAEADSVVQFLYLMKEMSYCSYSTIEVG